MKKVFPKLFALSSTGKQKEWQISVHELEDGTCAIRRTHGYTGKKMQTNDKIISSGKNIGRSNETTVWEQAVSDAQSLWNKKIDAAYTEGKPAKKDPVPLPMLALAFKDRKHNIEYPCYVQPKLNGCVFRTTKILTDVGYKSIEDIVEDKLSVEVLSFNEEKNLFEFKPIINWFNNGSGHYSEWLEIVPSSGKNNFIKCTYDHKILTNNGWKKAATLDDKKDKIYLNQHSFYKNSLLVGTLLGDSNISIDKRHGGTSYRLIFVHTNKNLFDFKVDVLGLSGNIEETITGYGSKGWRFVSKALTKTNFPIDKLYFTGHSEKIGQRKLLNHKTLIKLLTPESISLWIADDGSINYNNGNAYTPRLSLCTHNFEERQLTEFIKYFEKIWNCRPTINTCNKVNKRTGRGRFLTFSTKDTLFLLNQIRNRQCKGVEYKYYFPTEGYIEKPSDEFEFVNFHTRRSRRMPDAIKYDIEVKDNHNYVANGVVVHNCRVFAHKVSDNKIEYTSRKGKVFDTLDHFSPKLLKTLQVGDIVDGEIYCHGMSFQQIVRLIKKWRPESEDLQLHLYDKADPNMIYKHRLSWLRENMDVGYPIVVVESWQIDKEYKVKMFHDSFVQEGYEGAIIRNQDGYYKFRHRSKDLQKYKEFIDEEFTIVGGKPGTGLHEGCVTFICDLGDGTGRTFDACPKGTLKQKREMYKNLASYIGKQLTVRYQERSEDGVPIFPVGIVVRDYE